ncbi:MAG: signal peptide peptidase SppA [Epsilonproteobacteria bacterium]|nr:signal peptide peptidase SppA [Campylobacterota bacterium]
MELLKKIFLPITATLRFISEHFKALLFVLLLVLLFAPASEDELKPNNLEHITLVGPIFEASELVAQIEELTDDDSIKGVLVEVNSPGGAVAPSIEIAYAIKRLQTKKPVVVYASGILASGSYYASIWADKIVTNPGAMVGSIGVILEGADISKLMETIGVKTQTIQAGKYKKVGTMDRAWTDYEVNELNKVIQGTYQMFVADVASARGLDVNKSDLYANAHIFTAAQAKDVGLVDTLGVLYDAKNEVIKLSGVAEPIWNQEDKFEKFMKKLTSEAVSNLHIYFPAITLR